MAVLITVVVQGQTQQGYDGMLGVLADVLRRHLALCYTRLTRWKVVGALSRYGSQKLTPTNSLQKTLRRTCHKESETLTSGIAQHSQTMRVTFGRS